MADDGTFDPRAADRAIAAIPRPGMPFLVVAGGVAGLVGGLAALHHWMANLDWGLAAHAAPEQHASRIPLRVAAADPPPSPEAKAPPQTPPPPAAAPLPPADQPRPVQVAAGSVKSPRKIGYSVSYQPRENPDLIEGRTVNPAPACTLLPGQDIKASLVDRVSSEVPGDVTARVTEPVYAEAAGPGDGPLLPIGTKLVGSYKQTRLEPSRRRLDFTWQYAELPGGRTVRLGDAFGQDAGGAAGVTGKVDMHWGDLWLTGLILVTTGAVEYGTNSTAAAGGDIADAIGASAGREGGRLARETAARTLNLEPTITIRPGALITVRPRKMVRVC